MGTMTISEMRTDVARALGNRTDVTNAMLDSWINKAYRHVCSPKVYHHPALKDATDALTLATSTTSYSLTNVWAIDHVRYEEDNLNLTRYSKKRLDQLNIADREGPPRIYAREGNTLYIDTTPTTTENGDTLTVWGFGRITPLSDSNTTTKIEPEWDQIIVTGGVYYAWAGLGQMERVDFWRDDFAAQVNDIKEILDVEIEDESIGTRVIVQRYQA